MAFKDHFSTQAATYAAARPTYPEALFSFLAAQSPAMETALDVATGNGQAALGLAPHFTRVIACDASQAQIDKAQPADNVTYHCAGADALPVEDGSIDLITVAQALHWFPLDEFYAEVRRVLKPGGLIAAISYGVQQFDDPALNAAIHALYDGVLGDYWPPERFHIETEYRDLPFPFEQLETPDFPMPATWTLNSLERLFRQLVGDPALYQSAWREPHTRRDGSHWRAMGRCGQPSGSVSTFRDVRARSCCR